MKNHLYIILALFLSYVSYSQNYSIATEETIKKYERINIGQEVHIYMPFIKWDGKKMATITNNKNWKYNPKKDLLVIGTVTEKITTKGPNKYFRIKFKQIFNGKKSVLKMLVLMEEMSINNTYLMNLQDLRIE